MSFNDTIENIKTTLGEENAALVADDLISLMSDHKSVEDMNKEQADKIASLEVEKANLVSANSKLFQRIGADKELVPKVSAEIGGEQPEEHKITIGELINDKGEII